MVVREIKSLQTRELTNLGRKAFQLIVIDVKPLESGELASVGGSVK